MSANKLSSKPACESKKVFVEITGTQHNPEQSIMFYDEGDLVRQEWLEQQIETETLDNTTIHSWDWSGQNAQINAWLAVSKETGQINLPLYPDIQPKERQSKEQHYLLHSIVPLTLLPTFDKDLSYKDRIAPVRNGYLYIFYNDKAWREIEVRTQEDGSIKFRDVDLYKYREATDQPFKIEEREPEGLPISDIWVPAKANGSGVIIHFAYSEVQWSAQYLNYLESNKYDRSKRLVAFHRLNVKGSVDVLHTRTLPEMRARQPEIELFCAEPRYLSHDLSGNWLYTQYQEIKSKFKTIAADGKSALDVLRYNETYQYEYGMKHAALEAIVSPENSSEDAWKTEALQDCLFDARERKLRAIVLDDPLFDLRHNAFTVMYGIGYLQQVYADMSKQEYFQCAELVQRFVLPKKFGKQENPFYKHKDEFDTFFGGRFHRTMRTIERQICVRDVKEIQEAVELKMNATRTAQVLRDISSLNGVNASAAHVIAGYGLTALSMNIDNLDSMTIPENKKPVSFMPTVRHILKSGSLHPLHKILFPSTELVSLEDKYTPPEPFNSGTGFATPESLAQWESEHFIIEDDALKVMDLAFMAKANDNSEGPFATVRRISNTTDGILRGYFDAVLALSKNISEHAKVVEFNSAYAPVLALLKSTNSKLWGEALYVPVGGSELKGAVVGVHGHGLSYGVLDVERKHIQSKKNKTPMGRLYDKDGKLIASTGKKAFHANDVISGTKSVGKKLPLKVVVVPEGSEVAEALNREATQRTLQDIGKKGATGSNIYEALKVPYFITVIETINLINNLQHFKNMIDKKNGLHSIANAFSATLDLGVALAHSANFYTSNASSFAANSAKTLIRFPPSLVARFTFQNGSASLVSNISRLGTIGIFGGLLTAGIAAWDSYKLFESSDTDAGLAMGMVAMGTLVTTLATGLFTSSATFLGLGPIAWIGVGIAVLGFVLYTIFKDTPIEVWLKNGPFGKDPSKEYKHLQDPKTAFNRFIGLIFNISIKSYSVEKQTELPASITEEVTALGATHVIWVNTNLASLFNKEKLKIEFFARQGIWRKTKETSRMGIDYSAELSEVRSNNLRVLKKVNTFDGYAFFVKHDLPLKSTSLETNMFKSKAYTHTYFRAFNIRVRLRANDTIYPGPELDETFDNSKISSSPSFNKKDEDWLRGVAIVRP
ncbi:toxin VasX [Vibrio nigripulchritudo]|uniref:toxin VasX n=1 Tax=Vibrio nigripulchritudo TaxID=28173 RepID=UPI0003B18528|nr:toxin VasX [Vibrio nigripulchritudo]CCN69157.1 conserved membrane hypothetical protein [Vibrio nigripulchritudo SFn118]